MRAWAPTAAVPAAAPPVDADEGMQPLALTGAAAKIRTPPRSSTVATTAAAIAVAAAPAAAGDAAAPSAPLPPSSLTPAPKARRR